MRTRLWVFTNFDLEFDYNALIKNAKVRYIAYAPEKCPKTDRDHHQGWLMLHAATESVKNVAKLVGKCHVEPMYGSLHSNDSYCSKEGQLVELGDKPSQGERADLKLLKDALVNGETSVTEIMMDDPVTYHQYGRTLEKIEDRVARKTTRNWMTKGTWIWGETGCGKSHEAYEGYDESTHYVYKHDGGWWDGYTGQATVILDDFRGEISYAEMLRLVDKWPHWVRRRNREPASFIAQKLIVTCNSPPDMVYRDTDNDGYAQLNRRFTIAQKCREGNTEPLGSGSET